MAAHNNTGKTGEEMAVVWLRERGYEILHTNWQFGQNEIDIIAHKGKHLHFIEVKTRNYSRFGHPEDAVNRQKFKHMQRASDGYLRQHPGNPWIRYDIIAITLFMHKEPEIFFIEDIFY
jgi:putative endonuclease